MMNIGNPDYFADISFYNGMFIVLLVAVFVCNTIQIMSFKSLGENLIYRVRVKLFGEIMHKDVPWFDHKDYAPGVLTNILSEDITLLNGLTTETVSIYLEAVLAVGLGVFISFFFSWRMALITMAMSPMVMVGAMAKGYIIQRQ